MGCDIHMNVEMRMHEGWASVTAREIGKRLDGNTWGSRRTRAERDAAEVVAILRDRPAFEFYNDRNYALFARLANVRNRGTVKPLSEPRGLPPDVCHAIEKQFLGSHDHSASWFLLRELLDARPWTHRTEVSAHEIADQVLPWDDLRFEGFVTGLEQVFAPDDCRVVFWFDN